MPDTPISGDPLITDPTLITDVPVISAATNKRISYTNLVSLLYKTGAEVKTAYEGEADTNAFTDAEKAQVASHDTSIGILQQTLSTGFQGTPPVLTINGGDNTKFDISAGTIEHIDTSSYPPVITVSTVTAQTLITPTFLATETASFISIDSTGAIVQRNSRSTPEQRRTHATVGLVSHINGVIIDAAVNTPQLNLNAVSQAQDLMRAVGFFSTSGNQVSGIGASLTIQKATGSGFSLNENANVNTNDPHNFNMPALSPITLVQILQDATVIASSATIDPTNYDNAGVLTTVPSNNNATIARVYAFPNNSIVYMFGQEVFTNFSDAKDAAGTESFVLPSDIAEGGLLLARIVLKKTASDITNSSEAFILPSSAVSGGGSSLTSLQQAYDISVEPEILTDSTREAVSIQRGSALDTDDVFEIKNGAGTQVSSITGEGIIFGQGVQFPATQVPSADANTLDDYEEGTWTPTIIGLGGGSGQTYGAQEGVYQKIGDMVHVECHVVLNSKGTATGACAIGGLPFTSDSAANTHAPMSCPYATNLVLTAGENIGGYVTPNTSRVEMNKWDSVGGSTTLLISDINATASFMVTGFYKI